MDIQKIDLRRGDFEGMHPKAKLFGFDEDKKLYTGDGVESINDQWTTWCACIGMLCLDGKEAQVVSEGYVLVPVEPTGAMVKAGSWNDYAHSLPDNHVVEIYKLMIKARG
ncbi:hypothetical protein [Acinetobacter variabilis]|uniref:hypothetical protein n=1 Tax=Acinetobacter variabilis TaxID=70346 RepID=UPI00376FBC79